MSALKSILHNFRFSFSMAWRASKWMTIVRMLMVVIEATIPVGLAWIGKQIVDVLSNGVKNQSLAENRMDLILWLAMLAALSIVSILLRKLRENIESMHIDLINFQIDTGIMEKAARLDLSYFDSPKLYNEINIVSRDKAFLEKLIWNTTGVVHSIIGLVSCLLLLAGLHWSCSLIVAILCLPDAIIDQKLRKSI